jgi:hypothetical protein
MVPHPDDVEAVREALDQADRGELLSADESEAYLRQRSQAGSASL